MSQEILEYSDFSGGDYGRLENWRAPKNTFSGLNMLVSRTGELCVRPGVRDISPTGLTTGAVWHVGVRPDITTSFWFGQGTAIRYFSALPPGGALATASSALPNTPDYVAVFEGGATSYIQTPNDNGASFNGSAITTLGNMPDGAAIALYGDRLAVVPTSAPNTVVFSAAASFNNWTISAGNAVSVTVGDDDPITALIAQRTHLIIMKRNSAFYVLTGTPGTNESLRRVQRAMGPSDVGSRSYAAAARRTDDLIYYVGSDAQWPSTFDGTRTADMENIVTANTGAQNLSVVPFYMDDPSGVMINQEASSEGTEQLIWIKSRGAWTKHRLGVAVKKFAAVGAHAYPQTGLSDLSDVRTGSLVCFTDGGSASAAPVFYGWQPFMDRPGVESNPLSISCERAGDASAEAVSGSALLAEQRAKDGRELQVRGVIVDFRSWNTGSSSTNHFDLTVNTLNSYEAATPVASGTVSFDEAASQSSLAGDVRSKYFSLGDQGRGSAMNVQLDNVRGIAIQRIRIITETYPPRGF